MNNLNDSEKILFHVKSLQKFIQLNQSLKLSNPDLFQQRLQEKYGNFRERYPTLFQLIVDNSGQFEERRLLEMLRMRERVSNSNISYENASIQIGQKYFDEYVKPIVDTNGKK